LVKDSGALFSVEGYDHRRYCGCSNILLVEYWVYDDASQTPSSASSIRRAMFPCKRQLHSPHVHTELRQLYILRGQWWNFNQEQMATHDRGYARRWKPSGKHCLSL